MSEKEKTLQDLKLQGNHVIVKSNSLIESSYKLTLQEQRIVLALISKIRKEDRDFQWYKIRISKLAKFLGIEKNKNISANIRASIKTLMKRVITIQRDERDDDLHWIDVASYGKDGYVIISINKILKPYLLELKSHFTRYYLKYVINFKSIYSIRLYEILKRHEPFGGTISNLNLLKDTLGLKENEYTIYGNFKTNVLLVAQKEISAKTDIFFTFEEVKEWKKVVALRFFVKQNPKKDLTEIIDVPEDDPVAMNVTKPQDLDFFEALPDDTPENIKDMLYKIPEKYRSSKSILAALKLYLKEMGLDYVERNIDYANKKSNAMNPRSNQGKEANYISYLNKTLEKDWGLAYQENQQGKEEDEKKVKEVKEAEERKKRAEAEALKQEGKLFEQAKHYYEALPEETKEEIKTLARANMPEAVRAQVDRKGLGWKITLDFAIKRVVMERLTAEAMSRETKD